MHYKLLWIGFGVLGLAQLVQPDRTASAHEPADDLISLSQPAPDVALLLRTACYDCHSDETTYPWYCYVTPVNFWLQHHVNEGRDEMNMSEWGGRKEKWQRHKAKEAVEMLEDGSMPPNNYTWLHSGARLGKDQRQQLIGFFQELR